MNYCTYFDKNYLSRGLVLYQSLLKHSKNKFHLYIVAFDDFTFKFFKKNQFKFITCVHHSDFEDKQLKKVKNNRTKVEYLWTCTPSIIIFFLNKFKLKNCTYVDADIYFFSNPEELYINLDFSVLITSHNYHPKYDQSNTSGKYCVQYLTFKNDKKAMVVLDWWRKKCIKWCFNRVENGKFGDQKYLDNWPKNFDGVIVTDHLGAGVAPWNVKRFKLSNNFILENNKKFKLIFYHFHDLKFFFGKKIAFLSSYDLNPRVKKEIYNPYINKIISTEITYNLNFDNNYGKSSENLLSKLFFIIKLCIKFIIYFNNFKKIS